MGYVRSEVTVKVAYSTRLLRVILILSALCLLAASAFADTIKLKNGSVIKGRVVSFSQGEFTIILDLGSSSRKSNSRMIIAAEDIESIEFDSAASDSGAAPRSTSSREPAASERTEDVTDSKPKETPKETKDTKEKDAAATPPEPDTSAVAASEPSNAAGVLEKDIRVAGAADWTSSEIRITKGQRLTITAEGEVDLGNDKKSGPAGIALTDAKKLMANRPTGALIAVIGDDNDDFIYVGRSAEITAAHNGTLFLSVNEANLKDNAGSYRAKVKVMPAK